jgi:hypothetical protein
MLASSANLAALPLRGIALFLVLAICHSIK